MDDLERYVTERDARDQGFAALADAAERRQSFAREMAERRRDRGISQTQIAARMRTSPSIVSRLESGSDVKLSTLEKYVVALGYELVLAAPTPPAKPARAHRRKPRQREKEAS